MALNSISEKAVSLPFVIGLDGSVESTSDRNKVWSDRITSAIMTRKLERPRRSDFGSALGSLTLSTVNEINQILEKEIDQIFLDLFPNLSLTQLTVSTPAGTSTVNVELKYRLPSFTESNEDEVLSLVGFASVTDGGTVFEEIR